MFTAVNIYIYTVYCTSLCVCVQHMQRTLLYTQCTVLIYLCTLCNTLYIVYIYIYIHVVYVYIYIYIYIYGIFILKIISKYLPVG